MLYLRSVGGFADDHVDEIASATKVASVSTVMSLVDSGLLSLDDPVAKYLPSFTGAKASITLPQLRDRPSTTTTLPIFRPVRARS